MVQQELAGFGVELLFGGEVLKDDLANGGARGVLVLDLGDLPHRQTLDHRARHAIGDCSVARHNPLSLHARDAECQGTDRSGRARAAAGRTTVTRVPTAGALSTCMVPPCASTSALTTARPMPVPCAAPATSGTR